jgi:hypothetical protein
MRYNELKKKIKKIKARGYQKQVGCLCYFKVYKLNQWNLHQSISAYDLLHSQWEMNQFLDYLYEKNMTLLFHKLLEENKNRQE